MEYDIVAELLQNEGGALTLFAFLIVMLCVAFVANMRAEAKQKEAEAETAKALTSVVTNVQSEMQTLRRDFQKVQSDKQRLTDAIADLRVDYIKEVYLLKSSVSELKNERDDALKYRDDLSRRVLLMAAEQKELRGKIKALEDELQLSKASYDALQNKYKTLQDDFDNTLDERDALRIRVDVLETELHEAKARLKRITGDTQPIPNMTIDVSSDDNVIDVTPGIVSKPIEDKQDDE